MIRRRPRTTGNLLVPSAITMLELSTSDMNFFHYEQQYLLYLWHMLEHHDLLECLLQPHHDSILAGNGGSGIPSVLDGSVGSTGGGLLKACGDVVFSHKEELNRLSQKIKDIAQMEVEQQNRNWVA